MDYPSRLENFRNAPWQEFEHRFPDVLMVSHLCMKNYSIGMHSHDNYYEINFIASGKGAHYFEDSVFEVSTGDIFVIPPGFRHGYYNIDGLIVYHIVIRSEFMKKYGEELSVLPGFSSLFSIKPQLRKALGISGFIRLEGNEYDTVVAEIDRAAEKAFSFCENIDIYDVFSIHADTLKFIALLSKINNIRHSSVSLKNDSYDDIFEKALEIIHIDFTTNLTVENLAKRLSISKSTLYRIFNDRLSVSPKDYIIKLRLEKARKMIRNGNYKMAYIAVECGFFDAAHLSHSLMKYPETQQ